MALRERDLTFDLESGGKIVVEDGSVGPSSIKELKNDRSRLTGNTLAKDEHAEASNSNFANSVVDIIADENIELLIEKNLEGEDGREVVANVEKNDAKGKHTKKKKSQRPPRPPRGPSLDAADRMLVKEVAVHVMKKRARVERMKALKKAKAEKTSFYSCIPALVITFLFFLVIIIHGISSRSTSMLQGSPEPSVGFISVEYIKSLPPNESNVLNPPSVK